jgi:hypothetical protein
MIIGAETRLDFAYRRSIRHSPDRTIMQILELEGYGQESRCFTIFQYYIKKCTEDIEDPFLFIREYMADVVSS